MQTRATILGCGIVDDVRIDGTRGIEARWADLGVKAPGSGRTMRALFDKTDPTFRRLDLPGRALVLACEAADLESLLSEHERQEAAILVESDIGALVADQRFTASLDEESLAVSMFPFVLTTTCLGEVALRYGLRGPTVSLSISAAHPERAGESLREALRLFHTGEARHAVIGVVDAQSEPAFGRAAGIRAIVAVLAAGDDRDPDRDVHSLSWGDSGGDLFEQLASRCRRGGR